MAEIAAVRSDEHLLLALSQADAEFSLAEQMGDVEGELQANRRFHFMLYEAAQSPTLLSMILRPLASNWRRTSIGLGA